MDIITALLSTNKRERNIFKSHFDTFHHAVVGRDGMLASMNKYFKSLGTMLCMQPSARKKCRKQKRPNGAE